MGTSFARYWFFGLSRNQNRRVIFIICAYRCLYME